MFQAAAAGEDHVVFWFVKLGNVFFPWGREAAAGRAAGKHAEHGGKQRGNEARTGTSRSFPRSAWERAAPTLCVANTRCLGASATESVAATAFPLRAWERGFVISHCRCPAHD